MQGCKMGSIFGSQIGVGHRHRTGKRRSSRDAEAGEEGELGIQFAGQARGWYIAESRLPSAGCTRQNDKIAIGQDEIGSAVADAIEGVADPACHRDCNKRRRTSTFASTSTAGLIARRVTIATATARIAIYITDGGCSRGTVGAAAIAIEK